jgi:hypothetical protein
MALLGWTAAVVALSLFAHYVVIAYALYHGHEVKVGFKFPFVTYFFEANGHSDGRQVSRKQVKLTQR